MRCSSFVLPAICLHLVHGALRDDVALLNDADAVTHLLRDFERVRAHENRHAALAHAPKDVLDQPCAARIEPHHRFVHTHRLRSMEERRAHDEPLLHAVREALDQLVLPLRQLEQLEHLVHAAGDLAVGHSIETGVKGQELSRGELVVDERPIGDETQGALRRLRLALHVVVVDDDPAGRGLQQPGNHSHRRRLAGAVRTEEAVDLAGLDAEADAIDGLELAVGLDEVLYRDHLWLSGRSERTGPTHFFGPSKRTGPTSSTGTTKTTPRAAQPSTPASRGPSLQVRHQPPDDWRPAPVRHRARSS